MAIMFISASFSAVRRQYSSIELFIEENVFMFQFKETQMELNEDIAHRVQDHGEAIDMMQYLQESFSETGHAGSFVFVGNDGYVDEKYDQILVLFGQYSELAGLASDQSYALYLPEAHKDDLGKPIRIASQTIEAVNSVGANFDLFHPLYYFHTEDTLLANSLVLCTNDFQAVNGMFPWWRLSDEVFNRMVLVNPSEAEVNQLQDIIYGQYGSVYRGISTEEFTETGTIASMRAHRLYIFFYVSTGILLIIFLILNIIRMIEARVTDYTVHHLYGAPISIIRRRVGGFMLMLNIPPLIGVWFVQRVNPIVPWYVLGLFVVATFGLCLFAASYASKRIGTLKSLEDLRRDY